MYPYMNTLPMQQITRVNGEAGAHALRLPPNSSALVLDESAPLVWLCKSDGAGYMTVVPFSITEYKPAPVPSTEELISRIEKLEAKVSESYFRRTRNTANAEQCDEPSSSDVPSI